MRHPLYITINSQYQKLKSLFRLIKISMSLLMFLPERGHLLLMFRQATM